MLIKEKAYLVIIPFLFCRGCSEHDFEDDEGSEAIEERDVVQAVDEQPQPQDARKKLEYATPECKCKKYN